MSLRNPVVHHAVLDPGGGEAILCVEEVRHRGDMHKEDQGQYGALPLYMVRHSLMVAF